MHKKVIIKSNMMGTSTQVCNIRLHLNKYLANENSMNKGATTYLFCYIFYRDNEIVNIT